MKFNKRDMKPLIDIKKGRFQLVNSDKLLYGIPEAMLLIKEAKDYPVKVLSEPIAMMIHEQQKSIVKAWKTDVFAKLKPMILMMPVKWGDVQVVVKPLVHEGKLELSMLLLSSVGIGDCMGCTFPVDYPNSDIMVWSRFGTVLNKPETKIVMPQWDKPEFTEDKLLDQVSYFSQICIVMLYFLTFAENETTILSGSAGFQRIKTKSGKQLSDLPIDIEVIDSSYYRTIIREDGFKVSGHWRMQPYGSVGNKEYKLKWISEFEKHGYTRKSAVLKRSEEKPGLH